MAKFNIKQKLEKHGNVELQRALNVVMYFGKNYKLTMYVSDTRSAIS